MKLNDYAVLGRNSLCWMLLFWASLVRTWLSSFLSESDSLVRSMFCSIMMIVMGDDNKDTAEVYSVRSKVKIKGGDNRHKNDAQFSYR